MTPAAANAALQAPADNSLLATGPRTVGVNYVVFQSYKDEETAAKAKEALVAGGIGATVEKGHPYAPTWYVVIGTQGFVKTNRRRLPPVPQQVQSHQREVRGQEQVEAVRAQRL